MLKQVAQAPRRHAGYFLRSLQFLPSPFEFGKTDASNGRRIDRSTTKTGRIARMNSYYEITSISVDPLGIVIVSAVVVGAGMAGFVLYILFAKRK